MTTLAGKRIFVSGAAAGIGRSIAELSAKAGAIILATDRDPEALASLTRDFAHEPESANIRTALLDVTDLGAIEKLFAHEAPFDGIVNTAGWVHHGAAIETGDDDWRRSFQINVDSQFYVIRAALPGMIANGGGSIVNMASLASSIKGFKYRAAYAASKAAVIGLTKSVAVDYMDDGIRCNAICPGTTDTPSLQQRIQDLAAEMGGLEEARKWFIERQPMKRLGQPREIATFALYLLSDAGNFATGQAYVIDGGTIA